MRSGRTSRLDWVRRARDLVPLTLTGVLAVAGCLLALVHYGLGRIDLVLLALGVVGLALVGLTTTCVLAAALVVWLSARGRRGGDALRLECGFFTPTGFELPALRWLPFVDVRWTWVSPQAEVRVARAGATLREEIRPSARDHFEVIQRRIEVGEIFGVARIAFRLTERRGGRFAPWIGRLDQMHVAQGLAGGDAMAHPDGDPRGDLYDMRRYGAGDPIRFVLWKVFAKTRDLMVRTPEVAVSPHRKTIAYLVAADGDEPAAGAARVAVDSGALGTSWVLGADGSPEAVSSSADALELLARSAQARPQESGGLGDFLGRVGRTGGARAVVFVPSRPGPWLERVAAAARGPAGHAPRVDFVVCTDGIRDVERRSLWRRAAIVEAPAEDITAATRTEEVMQVVDILSATGATVLVVDRPNGRLFHSRSLRRMSA